MSTVLPSVNELMARMIEESTARIKAADEEAQKAKRAYMGGNFEAYFRAKCDESIKRMAAEYDRITGEISS